MPVTSNDTERKERKVKMNKVRMYYCESRETNPNDRNKLTVKNSLLRRKLKFSIISIAIILSCMFVIICDSIKASSTLEAVCLSKVKAEFYREEVFVTTYNLSKLETPIISCNEIRKEKTISGNMLTEETVSENNLPIEMVETFGTEIIEEETVSENEIDMTGFRYEETICYIDDIPYVYALTEEERSILERVVEAEVGTECSYEGHRVSDEDVLKSKIRVAQVFLNRVLDDIEFSKIDNMKEALLDPGATSTFGDGRYYSVAVSDMTREACDLAMRADYEDLSQGSLFFNSCHEISGRYGTFQFMDAVGHKFYK